LFLIIVLALIFAISVRGNSLHAQENVTISEWLKWIGSKTTQRTKGIPSFLLVSFYPSRLFKVPNYSDENNTFQLAASINRIILHSRQDTSIDKLAEWKQVTYLAAAAIASSFQPSLSWLILTGWISAG
jgi:hypothetical protein